MTRKAALAALSLCLAAPAYAVEARKGEVKVTCMVAFGSELLLSGACLKGSVRERQADDDKSFTLRSAEERGLATVTAYDGGQREVSLTRLTGLASLAEMFPVYPYSASCLFGRGADLKVCVWKL